MARTEKGDITVQVLKRICTEIKTERFWTRVRVRGNSGPLIVGI